MQRLLLSRFCGAVSDFGLATFPSKESLTAEGKKIGPVYYKAPEMLNEAANARPGPADVYSLAKSFWVLASGQNYPLPGQFSRNFEQFRISAWVTDKRAWMLESLLDRATDPNPDRRPTMGQFADELQAYLTSRDLTQSPVAQTTFGPKLQGNLVRRKRDVIDVAARRQDFVRLRDNLNEFSAQLAASLGDELGAEFVTSDNNANKLYLRQTLENALKGECYGGVVTICAGDAHKADSLQFLCGIVAYAESDDFRSIRLVAAQLCCRHTDAEKEFLWMDKRAVSSGTAELNHAVGELVTSLEDNIHVGLNVFEERTK